MYKPSLLVYYHYVFTFLVDILLAFVTISKEVSICRHSNSVVASNVVRVLNLDPSTWLCLSNGKHSARTCKLAPYHRTFRIQTSIDGSIELPLNNIARPGVMV